MQVSTILWEFIGWPRFCKLLYFLAGSSKWCRECSDEQSLRKRSKDWSSNTHTDATVFPL